MNDLVKEFAEIIADELNLIRDGSIIALKHVATGKYLSSIKNLCNETESKSQLVCFYGVFLLWNFDWILIYLKTS